MVPTLKQLRYFAALAETLHFGRAADRCQVTQPAMSMQVRELEALLGVILVERTTSGVFLTAAGEEVAGRAREILLAVQDLTDLARHRDRMLAGPLRLGVIPTIGPYLLPQVLLCCRKCCRGSSSAKRDADPLRTLRAVACRASERPRSTAATARSPMELPARRPLTEP